MPNVNPNAPVIAPGVSGSSSGYPQWGVGGGTPGSSTGWQIVEATTEAEKTADIGKGYVVWFTSESAAQSYMSGEESPYESGDPQNSIPGLTSIANFFGDFTQSSTWMRVAKVIVGGVLIIVGAAHLTGAGKAIESVASKVPVVPV